MGRRRGKCRVLALGACSGLYISDLDLIFRVGGGGGPWWEEDKWMDALQGDGL